MVGNMTKNKALNNIYSLLKQNIKSCNAKWRRQRRRTVKNNNRSNWQKSNFACAAHFSTFLCRCFAQLQRETSRNCLVIHFMEQISYVFLFTFFPLSLIFNMVAASISHFLTAATKFHVFLNKKCLLCFFSLALALFLTEIR